MAAFLPLADIQIIDDGQSTRLSAMNEWPTSDCVQRPSIDRLWVQSFVRTFAMKL